MSTETVESNTSPNLFTANGDIMNQCNIMDKETQARYYIQDTKDYDTYKTQLEVSRTVTLLLGSLLLIFLCIFTLNFSTYTWTAGNLITFILILGIGSVTSMTAKTWNVSSTMLNEMEQR